MSKNPKKPKAKPEGKSKKAKPAARSAAAAASNVVQMPTRGRKVAERLKGELAKADGETKERITKQVKRLISTEDKLSKRRKHWNDQVAAGRANVKEVIEEPFDEKERGEPELLNSWRDRVVVAWQGLEESRAGRENEMKDLTAEVRALRKAIREQVQNMNQVGLPFDSDKE